LIKEAKKYKSADEFVENFSKGDIEIYHWWKANNLWEISTDFADELSRTNQVELWKLYAEWPWIYFTSSIDEAKNYGWNIVKTKPSGNINILTTKSPKFSKKEVEDIIWLLPNDRVDIAIWDWGSKADLIDNILWDGSPIEQIQSIWSDVLYNQNNKDLLNALSKNGIDWISKKKWWNIHTVIYNKDSLK
jgi:hypothetical protein